MADYEPSTPAQLQVYNAAIAAGIPPAGIRQFIANEKSNFKTESDGSVSDNGIPISTALRLDPSISAKYRAPSKTAMTLAEFSAEHLAGRIKPHEFGTVEITGKDRQPLASGNRVQYDEYGIGPVMGGWR